MSRDLRNDPKAELFMSAGICSLAWQGDFGKGIATDSGVYTAGVNPCFASGPAPAPGVSGQGKPYPSHRLGQTVDGDYGAEFIYCKLTLAAVTDLIPGQAYTWDERYNASLVSSVNANNNLNSEVGICNAFASQLAIGVYYVWLQRSGHVAVMAAAASVANGQAEASATSGTLKFTANGAHTAGNKTVSPSTAFGASSSITFTANTVNNSPYLTAVANNAAGAVSPIEDLVPGMAISGAGIPANACIASIDKQGGVWRVGIGTVGVGTYPTPQNATATAVGVVVTVNSHVVANLTKPTFSAQN